MERTWWEVHQHTGDRDRLAKKRGATWRGGRRCPDKQKHRSTMEVEAPVEKKKKAVGPTPYQASGRQQLSGWMRQKRGRNTRGHG